MFFDILKHDIKRKKTMNIIVLLFVILAVTFISSSVNNLLAITNSLENFFDKSGVSDFITFEIGNSTPSAKEVAKNTDGVTEIKTEECIFVTKCEFGQEEIKNSIIIDSLKNSIQTFFDQNNMEISQVNDGEIYVPQTILDDKKADIGDSITLTVNDISKTFTVKGVLKDAILGSRFVGVKRLLVSDSDYQSFEKTDKANLQKMEINFIKTNNSPALKKNLVVCDSILNADDRSLFYYTYVMEMIVAGVLLVVSVCLIVISLVILSFTVSFTLSEEFRQIGIMQAIGIPDRKIRFIYMVKYLAISVVGAVVGLILSFPFGNMLLLRVSGSIVMTYRTELCWVFYVRLLL
ncbi:ABC transporter permease [Oscillospiraceae bacterium LCP25S3_E10]